MNCPKCNTTMVTSRDDNMIVNLCPSCQYSECYISEAEHNRIFETILKERENVK